MASVIRRLGLRTLTLGEYHVSDSGDPTARELARLLRGRVQRFDAVEDIGGAGIEPNVYLFGRGAVEVADLAVRISELYSRSERP